MQKKLPELHADAVQLAALADGLEKLIDSGHDDAASALAFVLHGKARALADAIEATACARG